MRERSPDRFHEAEVLQTRQGEPNADGRVTRLKLVKTQHKYPLLRVEEILTVGADGEDQIVHQEAMVADHVIVKAQEGTTRRQIEEVLQPLGLGIRKEMYAPRMYVISVPDASLDSVPETLQALRSQTSVVSRVQPDYVAYPLATTPNDPMLDLLWGLRNAGHTGGSTNADIRATEAWSTWTGSSNVLVAVIDTGVDYTHDDLSGNMWMNPQEAGSLATNGIDDDGNGLTDDFRGWDFYNGDNNPIDDNDHGTHCAGVVGAVGDNAEGVVGVCWDVSLVGLKVLSSKGSPDWSYYHGYAYLSDTIDATYYATDIGAKVMNNSWGLSISDIHDGDLALLTDAIEYANSNGVLYVAAAGNDARDNDSSYFRTYPASLSCSNIIAVAASTHDDGLASFSSYGATRVDLAAPGKGICSTVRDDRYEVMDGTSMSAPYVAGAAALLWSCSPDLSAPQVKAALLDSVDTNAAFAGKMVSGGRLNVARALSSISRLHFDSPSYFGDSWASLTLANMALTNASQQTVEITSDLGDSESLLLHETAAASGVFTNRLFIHLTATASPGNGWIEAMDGTEIVATYTNVAQLLTNRAAAAVSHALSITINTPSQYVPLSTESFQVEGVNNGNVLVSMVVSNEATGDSHSFAETNAWTAPEVSVTNGINTLWVSGTNAYGSADSASVTITRVGPGGVTNYVSLSGSHVWPFTSWETASTSIQAAVEAAFDGNSVVVTNGTYFLSSEVSVTRGITIRGCGDREAVLVDGQDAVRCFLVDHTNALVHGLTMQNGSATEGAAAYCAAGVVSNCVIRDSAGTRGGGVYCTLMGRAASCLLDDNSSTYGGGGYCELGGELADCEVVDSSARGGGGVFIGLGGVARQCSVVSNSASVWGGGAYVTFGGLVDSCNFEQNGSSLSWVYNYDGGGGLFFESGGRADRCAVRDNTAVRNGGGVKMFEDGLLRNSLVTGNWTTDRVDGYTGKGGGVYGSGRIENCTIVANKAKNSGGGTSGSLITQNSIIYSNSAPEDANYDGGTQIYCCTWPDPSSTGCITNNPRFLNPQDGDYRLSNPSPCIDTGTNDAWMAGALDISGQERVLNAWVDMGAYEYAGQLACSFTGVREGPDPLETVLVALVSGTNTSPLHYSWDFENDGTFEVSGWGLSVVTNMFSGWGQHGIGLTVSNSSGEVACCIVEDYINVGPAFLYVAPGGTHTAPYTNWHTAATNIQSAVDLSVNGTAVVVSNGSYLLSGPITLLRGVTLTSLSGPTNTVIDAQHNGRCLSIKHPDAQVTGFTFTGGGAAIGGGVYMEDGGTVERCIIRSNGAGGDYNYCGGGGVYLYHRGLLRNCIIKANNADADGGGVYLFYGGEIENCTVTGNDADGDNVGDGAGGIFFYKGGTVRNTIVYGNTAPVGDNYIRDGGGDFAYSCSSPQPSGEGNIDAAPLLHNGLDGVSRLLAGSPCVNAGTNMLWMTGEIDILGNPRIEFGTVDMGAHELPGDLSCYFSGSPLVGILPFDVVFIGHAAGTNSSDLHYSWDFDADGIPEQDGINRDVVTNEYTEHGCYSVQLTVSNTVGEVASWTHTNYVTAHGGVHLTFSAIPSPQTGSVPFEVTITARDQSNETVTVYSDSASLLAVGDSGSVSLQPTNTGAFTDGEWTGSISVYGTDTNVGIEAADASGYAGTSTVFDVTFGNLDHFEWAPITSPQLTNVPFEVTIVAKDSHGYTVSSFTNEVLLAGTAGSSVPVLPSDTTAFASGVWTGSVRVLQAATNMHFTADDGGGKTGDSGPFNVGVVELRVASDHGGAYPAAGLHYFPYDSQVACTVTNSPFGVGTTQYVCVGWTGSGSLSSDPSGGTNTGLFYINQDSAVSWLWQTNYALDLTVEPGTADVTNGWYAAGSELLATIDVPEGHTLSYWSGTTGGCTVAGTQITIPMDQPRSLTAHYVRTFYVNDGFTNLDAWCIAPGDDGNEGTAPSSPKRTVQSLLASLEPNGLEPGDIVRIDTGLYTNDSNIAVGSIHKGSSSAPVTFEASPYGVTIDRTNTTSGSYGWYVMSGADYVTIRTAVDTNYPARPQSWMKVTGGYFGLYVDGRYCHISRVDVCDNLYRAMYINDDHALVENCLARGSTATSSGTGIYIDTGGRPATVRNCTITANAKYGIYFVYYAGGTLQNNIIRADGSGAYALYRNSAYYSLSSDYNDLVALNGASVGYLGSAQPTLSDWQTATGGDANSINADPKFVDSHGGDYHLKSTAGSYHQGTWTTDTVSSAAIDAGYGEEGGEPEPNKTGWASPHIGRRNLGAYGGTEQGSKTPDDRRLQVVVPTGGEVYASQVDPLEISWRRFGAGWGSDDTLLLEYSANSGSTWTGIPGAGNEIATNGVYSWDINSLTPGPLYRVRMTCNQEPGVTDQSAGDFRIGEFLVFYANDASTTNDNWCSAPGSDVNNGLTPATPKGGVQAILDTYDLEPGDVVRIDTGAYTPTSNIAVGPADEGSSEHPVAFDASPYGVTVDRGTNAAGSYGWHIMSGADYVALRTVTSTQHADVAQSWMKITGGYYGLYVDGNYSTISRVEAAGNPERGMYIDGQHCRIENCLMHGSTNSAAGTGLYVGSGGDYLSVSNCTVTGNGKYGVYLGSASSVVLRNNIVVAHGSTAYGVYRASTGYSLDSDFNALFATNGAHVGFSGGGRATLLDWQHATAGDANSLGVDPGFVNPTSDDYHLMSSTGSYHQGTWAADPASSLAIDAGHGEEGDEPEPNVTAWAGVDVGRRNLGAYGGTGQGSKTPDERLVLRLIEPVGRETYVAQTNPVAVSWAWTGGGWQSNDTALIEYSSDSGQSWSGIPGADSVPLTNGVYSWDISSLTPGPLYRVRITCNQESGITDQSAEDFRIGKFLIFYVNNGSTNLDNWCTQPGSDLNDGVAPETPKASVQAILDTYDLEPGDVVRIDTGSYTNSGNIEVTSDDEGSSTDPIVFDASPYGVQIDRNNTGSGNYGWHLNHCDYVTVRTATSTNRPTATQSWMKVVGGQHGIRLDYANYCRVVRVEVALNLVDGVWGDESDHVTYSNCLVRANGDDGVYLDHCDHNTLVNCTIAGNSDDQIYADYSTSPLTVRNSILVADGAGDYAAAIYYDSYAVDWDYNCFVALNGAHVGEADGVRSTLADWQAATGGDANSTNAWPQFADQDSGDYHLMSVEGRYVGGSMWVRDTHHSPCIDAGDPAAAWTNEPPANGGRLNMGAYGNTRQASKSPTNTVWTLQIASDHGSATPPVDTHIYYESSLVNCSVTPEETVGNTRYLSDGWTLAGQGDTNDLFAGSSQHVGLILTNHAVLTWLWSTNDWVDHYVWDSTGATQYLHDPFPVRVSAQDAHGAVVTGYTGTASVSAWLDPETTNTVYGSASHNSSSSSTGTRGIRLTPSSDLTVTHVRHYWGGKVSIWEDDGTLLASSSVTSSPPGWLETPLNAPVTLLAGQTYRIGAYYASGSSTYYRQWYSCPFDFPNGEVLSSCYGSGDAFPSTLTSSYRYFVDVVYTAGPFDGAGVSPINTGSFVAGVWTGAVAVLDAGSNAYLHAEDANGRDGNSSTFDVLAEAPMGTSILWLRQHGLTNGPCYVVELQNPDGDPMPTWEEYIADTIPTDGNSFLAITGVSASVDGIRIMWKGGTNAWQCLESREDLVATGEQWLAVFTNVPPTPGTTNYLHHSATNRVLYYRLKAWR